MKKVLILFDGSNFYNKVKRLLPSIHLTKYKYNELGRFIIPKKSIVDINYYVGEIKKERGNRKSERLYSSQQSFFENLRDQNVTPKLGYLLKFSGIYHEKGVDVQIAVDIIYGTLKNHYDEFYLISSDTDLLPAIKIAQEEGKKVIYVGFEGSMSKALCKNCSSFYVLKKSDLLKFN